MITGKIGSGKQNSLIDTIEYISNKEYLSLEEIIKKIIEDKKKNNEYLFYSK
ncbi:hypothetical protein QRT07_09925 [Vibrio parahaemolyticus]|uniref:hypothetical protein n=1 Tax=Vibrio parahaemolyticus TaxID=670 RepID=UPI002570E6AA|nr:hypothetical protein [Vibrio parahaemolyticus]WJE02894.1 hypothetical protein QRT07_09925 [Vibrio parahaemolyticus]